MRASLTNVFQQLGFAHSSSMGTSALPGGHMPGAGSELRVGNYDVEVQDSVSYDV